MGIICKPGQTKTQKNHNMQSRGKTHNAGIIQGRTRSYNVGIIWEKDMTHSTAHKAHNI